MSVTAGDKQISTQSLDAGGGLVGIDVGHKGEKGVGKLAWLGWRGVGPEPPVGRKTVLQGEEDRMG